jgi:hypothetical protein
MAKKLYAWRLSDDVNSFIEQYKEKHKLKNVDDALKLIIQRLQYLEDLALEAQKEPQQPDNPIEWIEKHPCPYRTIYALPYRSNDPKDPKDGNFIVSCAEKKHISIWECMTRQKRYLEFNRKCRPIGMENKKRAWQKRTEQQPKTRTWKPDEFERAYYSDDYFREDWGDTF